MSPARAASGAWRRNGSDPPGESAHCEAPKSPTLIALRPTCWRRRTTGTGRSIPGSAMRRCGGTIRAGGGRRKAGPTVPSLAERGLKDGVAGLYVRMSERGELVCTGGEAVDIAALLQEGRARFGAPSAIAADRWRVRELADILNRIGLPRCPLHERGQGYMDGGADVRDFRRACREGRVRPVPSLLLASAIAEPRTVGDPAGNWKLAKSAEGGRRRRAKDDAAAAAILAVTVGARAASTPHRRWRNRGAAG